MGIISIQKNKNLMKNNDKKDLNLLFNEKFLKIYYQLTLQNVIINLYVFYVI